MRGEFDPRNAVRLSGVFGLLSAAAVLSLVDDSRLPALLIPLAALVLADAAFEWIYGRASAAWPTTSAKWLPSSAPQATWNKADDAPSAGCYSYEVDGGQYLGDNLQFGSFLGRLRGRRCWQARDGRQVTVRYSPRWPSLCTILPGVDRRAFGVDCAWVLAWCVLALCVAYWAGWLS